MKKTFVPILGLLMGICLTAVSQVTKDIYFYESSENSFSQFTGIPCPAGDQVECQAMQPGVGLVTVLKSENSEDILHYNP